MVSVLNFIYFIVDGLLGLLVLAIIVNAIMSWLFAFDVVNYRNRFVYSVARFLEAVTAPIQRIIPTLGGVDISPIIALLIIQGIRQYLLPAAFGWLAGVVGGG